MTNQIVQMNNLYVSKLDIATLGFPPLNTFCSTFVSKTFLVEFIENNIIMKCLNSNLRGEVGGYLMKNGNEKP